RGEETVPRDRSVGGLDTDRGGEGGGLTDGTTGVGAHGERCLTGGQGRCRAATGAAGGPVVVPRVAGGAVRRVLGGGAHRELVEVRLAENRDAGRAQACGHRRVVGRNVALEHLRGAGGGRVGGGEHVLERDRDTGQRAELLARGQAGVHGTGGLECGVGAHVEEGVDLAVHLGDPVQVCPGDLLRGDLAGCDPTGEL